MTMWTKEVADAVTDLGDVIRNKPELARYDAATLEPIMDAARHFLAAHHHTMTDARHIYAAPPPPQPLDITEDEADTADTYAAARRSSETVKRLAPIPARRVA